MARLTYNLESLARHQVSLAEVDLALATGIWEEIAPSKRGYSCLMFIGFTSTGRLVEVSVEYFDVEDVEHVFHANDANVHNRRVFKNRMKP